MRNDPFIKSCFAVFLLVLLSIVAQAAPVLTVNAEDTRTVVRVGWHEPPYFITDETGRKSGYSYEYQRKVAAYTGWEYEYVEGSWADLMQMMKEGKIDLLSDVSYSEERTRDMLFTSIPMGTEVYYVFVSPDNTEICSENLSSLNGKTIGSSDFYFAVNKKRPDLLLELDAALNKIQDENKYYDQQLHDKYLKATETIRVGYQDNYLAFCAKDPSTGALTYYSTEDVKVTFWELVKEYLWIIMADMVVILLIIIALLLRSIRAEKKVLEEEHLVKKLNDYFALGRAPYRQKESASARRGKQ